MKKSNYRIFIKSSSSFSNFPLRLLKFKKQKWLPLQSRLRRLIKPAGWKPRKFKPKFRRLKPFQLLFKNPMYVQQPCSRWVKLKRAYSNEQMTKRLFFILYQRAISQKFLRAQVKAGAFMPHRVSGLFAKPFYRIDVLLRFFNFFSSVYQARQALSRKIFLLNQTPLKVPQFLASGDLIELKKEHQNPLLLASLRKKYSPKKKFLTFIQVDYYTKSISILQNSKELSPEEIGLLFYNKISFRSFRNVF